MRSSDPYRCRVCGLLIESPPWGLDGRTPLYEHCPCCGVEFGYQDATTVGAKKFREAWLATGAKWSESEKTPPDWSPTEQLEHVPEEFR